MREIGPSEGEFFRSPELPRPENSETFELPQRASDMLRQNPRRTRVLPLAVLSDAPQEGGRPEETAPTEPYVRALSSGPIEERRLRSSVEIRRRAHDISAARIELYLDRENKDATDPTSRSWYPKDAALERGDHSFDSWFRSVLPEDVQEDGLRKYVEATLESDVPKLGLELGGVGSSLFGSFTEGFFSETRGVSLTDLRDGDVQVSRDAARNHEVITGNVLDDTVKHRVDGWLDGRKLDFIAERMYAGIHSLPDEPFTLSKELAHWYERLSDTGLMLVQVPKLFDEYMDQWKNLIEQHPGLDVQVGKNNRQIHTVMRLQKLEGAPEQLPLIDAYEVMRKERERYGSMRRPMFG